MRNTLTDFVSSEPVMITKLILVFFLGPLDIQLTYLLIAMIIDLYFGIKVARKENNFSFFVLREKMQNKLLMYVTWITLFHAFDMITGFNNTARWSIIVLLASMEILSAIKNTAKLGHSTLASSLERVYLALVKGNPLLSFLDKEEVDDAAKGGNDNDEEENEDNTNNPS